MAAHHRNGAPMTQPDQVRDADFEVVGRTGPAPRPWGMDLPMFLTLIHLALLVNYLVPGLGFVLPIVMWATAKDLDRRIDAHGKVVLNWIISAAIYGLVFGVLCIVLIGYPLLLVLAVANFAFSIIGAVKANRGSTWNYPGSIRFFRPIAA